MDYLSFSVKDTRLRGSVSSEETEVPVLQLPVEGTRAHLPGARLEELSVPLSW